jgi:hypothetical protein
LEKREQTTPFAIIANNQKDMRIKGKCVEKQQQQQTHRQTIFSQYTINT